MLPFSSFFYNLFGNENVHEGDGWVVSGGYDPNKAYYDDENFDSASEQAISEGGTFIDNSGEMTDKEVNEILYRTDFTPSVDDVKEEFLDALEKMFGSIKKAVIFAGIGYVGFRILLKKI